MPAGESVGSNHAFTPGKKSFKKLLTEQKNADKISLSVAANGCDMNF